MDSKFKYISTVIIFTLVVSCSYVNKIKSTFAGEFPDSMLNTKTSTKISAYDNSETIKKIKTNADSYFKNEQWDEAYNEYIKALKLASDNKELFHMAGISKINYFLIYRRTPLMSVNEQIDALFKAYYLLSEAVFRGSKKAQYNANKYLNTGYYKRFSDHPIWLGGERYWEDEKWMKRKHDELFNG